MKRKLVIFCLFIGLIMAFYACSGAPSTQTPDPVASSQAPEVTPSPEATPTPTPEVTPTIMPTVEPRILIDEGAIGDYYIKILNAESTETSDGAPGVRIYYEFTNNSDESTSFAFSIVERAIQDDQQTADTYASKKSVPEDRNSTRPIEPGTTITVASVFMCTMESPLEIELTEFLSPIDEKIVKTFTFN